MEGKVIEILNSTDPKPASDKPMLYTHLLCPYAERGRIAAALKQLDHQQVDIGLSKKPDWYFTINPNGTVPTLQFPDGRTLYESDIIAEALDDLYPDQGAKLLPENKLERGIMKCRAKLLTGFISAYYATRQGDAEPEKVQKLSTQLKKLEDELADGRKFLWGEKIQLIDILVYPHLERVIWYKGSVAEDVYNASKIDELKNLLAYYERVREIDELKPVLCVPKAHQLHVKRAKEQGGAKLVLPVVLE